MKTDQTTLAYIVEGSEGTPGADMHELSDEAVALLSGGQDRDLTDQGGSADLLNGGSSGYSGYTPVYPKLESGFNYGNIDYNFGAPSQFQPMPYQNLYDRPKMVKNEKKKKKGKKPKKLKAMKIDHAYDEFGSDAGL